MSSATAVQSIVANPPRELFDFAKRQMFNEKARRSGGLRAHPRDPIVVPVVVQPVDENLMPIGESIDVVSRDLSSKGVGLVHLGPIPYARLALHMKLANTEVNLAVTVRWRGPLGPFYGTGAEIMSMLNYFPQPGDFRETEAGSQSDSLSPLALAAEQCLQTAIGLADDLNRGRAS